MPVYQAAGSLILHFGYGDICMSVGRNADKDTEDELVFVEHEAPHVIGEYTNEHEGMSTADLKCPLRMVFDKIDSVDVVIERLQLLKATMIKHAAVGGGESFRAVESPAISTDIY